MVVEVCLLYIAERSVCMSRSYKKTAVLNERKNGFVKKNYNRRLRRRKLEELYDNGGSYKKMFEPWDICDWVHIAKSRARFADEMIMDWFLYRLPKPNAPEMPTYRQCMKEYDRLYKRKF